MKTEIATRYTISPDAKDDGEAIVFIHGLSGSPGSTWGKMAECIDSDPDFAGVTVDYYAYPTRLVRLPFTPPLPGLRDLADGLRTFLEERHGRRATISIVAHSLGGLIARHLVTSNIRLGSSLNIRRIALLAVPSTGSTLANVGSLISFPHRQLKALSRDEGGLTTLNIDWEHLKVEDLINVRYILGGSDRTVPSDSAVPYIGRNNKSVIIDADHRSIVAPNGRDDLRYKTLKRFLKADEPMLEHKSAAQKVVPFERPADPLFDVYTPINETFYLKRSFDSVVLDVMSRGHMWLTGDSGIGKSAAARRAIYSSGWRLFHINLSAHDIAGPERLLASLCAELASISEMPLLETHDATFNDQAAFGKRLLMDLRSDSVTTILVEEMPLNAQSLGIATQTISKFLEILDSDDRLYGQIRFVFSSRIAVSSIGVDLSSKVREKIQFLPVDLWSEQDITRLIQLLTPAVKSDLSAQHQSSIAQASKGSPRFVKMVFRHWRNRTAGNSSVEELCAQVGQELVL
ncbi:MULTISPECIES: esterase/lipase family protein [unclassified Novosphingobium]|uniref:esterase/lipase family protein n=1 Tax=unclassified Novosphingobium TaxID=2644732 RepID=UPI001404650B|nr:alpha/beta hydrolase [Novosphingobium sp. ST904]